MAKYKRFLTSLGAGALIVAAVLYFNRGNDYGMAQRLSDGCFVSAVMLLGIGGLGFANNHGLFDVMGYSIKAVFQTHYPGMKATGEKENFADYKKQKAKKRKSPAGMLWAGLVYLVLAAIALAAYFCV